MAALIHKRADGTQKLCELSDRPLVIGRLPESDIHVRDTFISRSHASIIHSNNTFIIKDLSSANGTYKNGERVYECHLATGDKIQLGNAVLIFEIDSITGNALLLQVAAPSAASRHSYASTTAATTLPVHTPANV